MSAMLPVCPECGADHEATPDAFGVHPCSECGAQFRPPRRVPIRRAGSSEVKPDSNTLSWVIASAIGIGVVTAIALGDSHAPSDPAAFQYQPIQIEIPSFDPITLQSLTPLGPVALAHEVHSSRVVEGRLQATGLLRNDEASELLSVVLELRFLDVAGASLGNRVATVACPRIAAHATCAWALDASIPAGMVEFEFSASAQPNWIGDVFPTLELRRQFDEAGRPLDSVEGLELDVREQTVRMRVPEDTRLFDVWATLTVLDAEGRVVDVLETRWAESLVGTAVLSIAVPQHESARYDLRVGGSSMSTMLSVPHAPEQPG
jgi:hypothetical protein